MGSGDFETRVFTVLQYIMYLRYLFNNPNVEIQ